MKTARSIGRAWSISLWIFGLCLAAAAPARAASAVPYCPSDGVRFGVEPYEDAASETSLFSVIGALLAQKLGCSVTVYVASSYNAEIEAMRADELELGEFGALAYVLAHRIAGAQAIATYDDGRGAPSTYYASIVTWPGSGISSIKDVAGHSFAFSDPVSTSGHLLPAYGLRQAGIDPSKDIFAEYAGSHVASFEALLNRKVDAGELNSQEITAATAQGAYTPQTFVTLWKSQMIPNDAIAVRGDLPDAFKKRLTAAVLSLRFASLTPEMHTRLMNAHATAFIAQSDSAYDPIRDLAKTLDLDLTKL